MANKTQIVIKRVNKGGHGGHHGGAWKVAYADFVTAMMCFFLVMWLMGSDEETKASISSYFNNPNPTTPMIRDLKDNENTPLGNRTGAGESILKGAAVEERVVKDPAPLECRVPLGSRDEKGIVIAEAITGVRSLVLSISEDEIFEDPELDKLIDQNSKERLSAIGKITSFFKGTLHIRGLLNPSRSKSEYELKISRLVAIQRFIVSHQWMDEDSIRLIFRKELLKGEEDSYENPKVEFIFLRSS